MKKVYILTAVAALLAAACAKGPEVAPVQEEETSSVVKMYSVSDKGIGNEIGQIILTQTENGVMFDVSVILAGYKNKTHGFHIHENPSCEAVAADGKKGAALAAGGHFDPHHSGMHEGPHGNGHKGDLPSINTDLNSYAAVKVLAPRLSLKEVKNRSLMIHEGGDNYKDAPKPLGGGGARIACGIIK